MIRRIKYPTIRIVATHLPNNFRQIIIYFWHGVTMNKDASVHKGADDMRVLNEIAMPYIDIARVYFYSLFHQINLI
jgi:hypothetical protein